MTTEDVLIPIPQKLTILLADDDKGDCLLFKEALEELPVEFELITVPNGEKLLDLLTSKGTQLPDVVFLDLNMPRKNGFASLGEIKRNNSLFQLPVIIFSGADEREKVKQVYRDAAHYYIRKPTNFADLKKVIYKALILIIGKKFPPPGIKNFVLTDEPKSSSDEIQKPRHKPTRKTH
jgi:CheY-like chemotaxis protein